MMSRVIASLHLWAMATDAVNTMVGPCGASSASRAASSAGFRAAGHSTLNSDSSLGSVYLLLRPATCQVPAPPAYLPGARRVKGATMASRKGAWEVGVSVLQDAMRDKTCNNDALLCGKQSRSSLCKRCRSCRAASLGITATRYHEGNTTDQQASSPVVAGSHGHVARAVQAQALELGWVASQRR